MKVLKKIGLGIISLGLISTFYIPEAKANQTLLEYTYPSSVPVLGGRTYAIKLVTSYSLSQGKFLLKRVGSGNTSCKMWIANEAQLDKFVACTEKKLGSDVMNGLIEKAIDGYF